MPSLYVPTVNIPTRIRSTLGIMVVPTDLEYFISFEKQDYEKRCQRLRETHCLMMRSCPTSQMYRDHQVRQGLVSPKEPGGLYRIIVLQRMYDSVRLAQFGVKDWPEFPYDTKARIWHGAPMATIRQAFIGLASLRVKEIPPDIINSLRQLQYLYSCEPTDVTDIPKALTMLSFDHIMEGCDEEHHDNKKTPWNDENDSETSLPESKRACLIEDYKTQAVIKCRQAIASDVSNNPHGSLEECPLSPEPCKPLETDNSRSRYWDYGPDYTSSMIIEKIKPLYEELSGRRDSQT